jgi:hypothetical protein
MTKDEALRAAFDRHPDCTYAEVIEGAHLTDPVWIVCLWASSRRRAECLACDYQDVFDATGAVVGQDAS